MGLTSLPRLYFRGQFFWSPSTYNNNDYAPAIVQYDPTAAKVDWSFLREQGVNTDAEFAKWSINPISTAPSAPFTLPPAEWGYYGGNQSGFVTETTPNIKDNNFSVPIGPNRKHTATTGYTNDKLEYVDNDPWVGLPLQFNLNAKPAKLVDINPTLPWTSQIFSDTLTIGGKEQNEGFTAPVKYRMHSRWIYTNRNYKTDGKLIIAGGLSTFFQTVVHKEDITFFNENPEPGNYQDQLQKSLKDSDGIMIRFMAYDTIYFQGKPFDNLHEKADDNGDQTTELMVRIAALYKKYEKELEDYKNGKRTEKPRPPINRAYSRVVGWTGLWNKDELISMAEGRTLLPLVLPGQPDGLPTPDHVLAKGLPASYYVTPPSAPGAPKNRPPAAVQLGPLNIVVAENQNCEVERITVDMGTTMPELNSLGIKANFGEVKLKLYDLSSKTYFDIATLPNDLDSYHKTSGVYDITDLSDEVKKLIQTNPLALFVDSYNIKEQKGESTLALIENPVMSNTNSRGVYVNQPDPYWENPSDVEFKVKVQNYGKPPAEGEVQLSISQCTSSFDLIDEKSEGISDTGQYTQKPFVELRHRGKVIHNSTLIPVPSDGLVSVKVTALQPGMPFLVFFPALTSSGYEPPGNVMATPTYYSYNAIRSLPFDNVLAEEFETWLNNLILPNNDPPITVSSYNDLIGRVNQRVFDDVFRTFHLLYPVMGFIGCPMQFQEWRGRILKLTDPAEFNSAAYMPVTRSLSAGQRRILVAYTDFLDKLPTFDMANMLKMTNLHHHKR